MPLVGERWLLALSILFILYLNTSTHTRANAGSQQEIGRRELQSTTGLCLKREVTLNDASIIGASFNQANCGAESGGTQWCLFNLGDAIYLTYEDYKNFIVTAASNFVEVFNIRVTLTTRFLLVPIEIPLYDWTIDCPLCGRDCKLPLNGLFDRDITLVRRPCPYVNDINATLVSLLPDIPQALTALVRNDRKVDFFIEYAAKEGDTVLKKLKVNLEIFQGSTDCGDAPAQLGFPIEEQNSEYISKE